MSLEDNIINAFKVVEETHRNVEKLMNYCDSICEKSGYVSSMVKYLRYKSDNDVYGWTTRRFIKLYQSKKDSEGSFWRDGPIFALEIQFDDKPIYKLGAFLYKDISKWRSGISVADQWVFHCPMDKDDNDRFTRETIEEGYFKSKVKSSYEKIYRFLEFVVYTEGNLTDLKPDSIEKLIFDEFDVLRSKVIKR